MLGKRIINTGAAGAACTTDTVQILDGVPFQSIATYQLDGNANDLTGNYNGTASNVTYSTGQFGQAGVFNGSSSVIQASGLNQFFNNWNDASWSAWINTTDTSAQFIVCTSTDSQNYKLIGGISSNKFQLVVRKSSTVYSANSTTTINDGNWHHIAATYDNSTGTVKGYVDGSEEISLSTGGTSSGTFTVYDFCIGANKQGSTVYNPLDGKLDQVRIYDKALSAADVTTLYNETAATASTNITLEVPSLVAYYKMSDATDETGSYDGTPTNVNFNVAGKFGNAGYFNGSSSYISAANILDTSSAFSYSFWINPSTISSLDYVIGHQQAGSPYAGISLLGSGSNKLFLSISGGTAQDMTPSLSLNTWSHIVLTHDGSGNYVCYTNNNGSPISYSGATSNNSSNPFRLGFSSVSGWGYFEGKIDQVRIFDKAITADEVTTLYNEVECIPTIVPTDHFEPVIYTGNGSSQSISTLDFQPDFVWLKRRDVAANHRILDSVRGADLEIYPNLTNAEGDFTTLNWSFDSNGFSFNTSDPSYNALNGTYVTWNFKAGGDDVQNTDGTITSQVSANVDAGFSIVSYTGNQTSSTIGHGLSQAPEMIIAKSRTVAQNWAIYHKDVGNQYWLRLNGTNAKQDEAIWNDTTPTDSVFSINNNVVINASGSTNIAYCFHSVDGMSRIGSYVGTNASNSIVTGFRPAFLMVKLTSAIDGQWVMYDNARNTSNPITKKLAANFNGVENDSSSLGGDSSHQVNFLSNGFELLETSGGVNTNKSGETYIFMAFAEENVQPQPVLANSFNTVTYTGNGSTQAINTVGFQPDLVWVKERTSTSSHALFDSVRGINKVLASDSTATEDGSNNTLLTSFDSNGFSLGNNNRTNQSGIDMVAWCWKASNESTINQDGSITSIVSANPAAGFSVVKYDGTGVSGSYGHGLLSAPELIITKNIDWSTPDWFVYHKDLAVNGYLRLSQSTAEQTASTVWSSAPTSTVVNIGNDSGMNNSNGNTQIAYCFHSVDGYQKVGSYSGSGSAGKIVYTDSNGDGTGTGGFQPRFVMIKRTNASTDQASCHWLIFDSNRLSSGEPTMLRASTSDSEFTGNRIEFVSTGFRLDDSDNTRNQSGGEYIYLAIA